MDEYTRKHLYKWLERVFHEDEIEQVYDYFVGWLERDGFDNHSTWSEMYRRFQSETTLTVPRL